MLLEYGDEIWHENHGLPYGEEIMIVGQTMWTQSMSVTDRQTDRFTMTKIAHCKNRPVFVEVMLRIL